MKAQPKKTSIEKQKEYYVAAPVVKQLNSAKDKVIRGDQDRIFVVDGKEGSGKSTLALQIAYHIDPTLTLEDVVFNGDDLQKRIRYFAEKRIKNKCIIFDEAFNGLSSKAALSKINRQLVQLFMECRQLNLFIFIVLPSVFLLEKYVAIFRSHGLFHVFVSRKDVKRRYYKIYNYKAKKYLFLRGQKMLDYGKPRIKKTYRFYSKYPPTVSKLEYDQKKIKSFYEIEKKDIESKYKVQRDFAIAEWKMDSDLSERRMEERFLKCKYPMKSVMLGIIGRTAQETRQILNT